MPTPHFVSKKGSKKRVAASSSAVFQIFGSSSDSSFVSLLPAQPFWHPSQRGSLVSTSQRTHAHCHREAKFINLITLRSLRSSTLYKPEMSLIRTRHSCSFFSRTSMLESCSWSFLMQSPSDVQSAAATAAKGLKRTYAYIPSYARTTYIYILCNTFHIKDGLENGHSIAA